MVVLRVTRKPPVTTDRFWPTENASQLSPKLTLPMRERGLLAESARVP